VAAATGDGSCLFAFFLQLAMTIGAHAVVGLAQIAAAGVQIRLQPKAGAVLVALTTLDPFGILFQLSLVHRVLSTFKPVVAGAAFDLGVYV
jgi:hypothetical protein